jgi:hypothetical protein
LLPSFTSAVIAAAVSFVVATRFCYRQRWWERQADAYTTLLGHLAFLRYALAQWYDDVLAVEMSGDRKRSINAEYKVSIEYVTKTSGLGGYVISTDSALALRAMIAEFEKRKGPNEFLEELESDEQAVLECIEKVREEARKALGKFVG